MQKMIRLTTLFSLLILLIGVSCNSSKDAKTAEAVAVANAVASDCIDARMVDLTMECAEDYAPVCGCDGETYKNECVAKRAGLLVMTANACLDCLDPAKKKRRPCPKMFKPVCGCDGVTYSNACEADCAGIQKYTEGKCGGSLTKAAVVREDCIDLTKQSMRPCPEEYKPVCGCDGKTYSNQCSAEVKGLTAWTKGACGSTAAPEGCIDESRITNRGCPESWDPVCGCDGVTYTNECAAKSKGITNFAKGECGQSRSTDCIDASKVNPQGMCPMNYDPVCGCNGVTYSNECKAIIAGVTKWEKGDCKK